MLAGQTGGSVYLASQHIKSMLSDALLKEHRLMCFATVLALPIEGGVGPCLAYNDSGVMVAYCVGSAQLAFYGSAESCF